ncbi:hypothetical protein [Mycobacterium sp. OAE908]|uniref:hypothetical protein n=1 Tax=Mycobacterium sp. OAE908 TaxID=2817899 RepID=UPI001AE221E4
MSCKTVAPQCDARVGPDQSAHLAPATTTVDQDAAVPKGLRERRLDTGVRIGWLCAVRAGCSRGVLGSAIEDHLHTDLVESAMSMSVAIRDQPAERVNLHADRGCPYTSTQLARFARKHNLACRAAAPGSSG